MTNRARRLALLAALILVPAAASAQTYVISQAPVEFPDNLSGATFTIVGTFPYPSFSANGTQYGVCFYTRTASSATPIVPANEINTGNSGGAYSATVTVPASYFQVPSGDFGTDGIDRKGSFYIAPATSTCNGTVPKNPNQNNNPLSSQSTILIALPPTLSSFAAADVQQPNPSFSTIPPPSTLTLTGNYFSSLSNGGLASVVFSWSSSISATNTVTITASAVPTQNSLVVAVPTLPTDVSSLTATVCNPVAAYTSCSSSSLPLPVNALLTSSGTVTTATSPATLGTPIAISAAFTSQGSSSFPGQTTGPMPTGIVTFTSDNTGTTQTIGTAPLVLSSGGSWAAPSTTATANGGFPALPTVTADLNNDGLADLVLYSNAYTNGDANPSTNVPAQFTILLGNMPYGTFQAAKTLAIPSTCASVASYALGNLNSNEDNFPDLVFTCVPTNPTAAEPYDTYIFFGNGDGTFSVNADITNSNGQMPGITGNLVALADINKDGYLDLVSQGLISGTTNYGFVILPGDGYGDLNTGFTVTTGTTQPGTRLLVTDLNNDGYPDIAELNGGLINIYQNSGGTAFANTSGTTTPTTSITLTYTNDNYISLFSGDIQKSGFPALAVADNTSPIVIYAINTSTTGSTISFSNPQAIQVGSTPIYAAFADYNGDGYPDLLSGGSTTYAYPNDGTGNIGSTAFLTLPVNNPQGIAAVDLNGDSVADLVALPIVYSSVQSQPYAATGYLTTGTSTATLNYTFTTGTNANIIASWPGSTSIATSTTPAYALPLSGGSAPPPTATTPTITYNPTPTTITSGTALIASQLNATATDANNNSIDGSFTYTYSGSFSSGTAIVGTVLPPDTYAMTANFTPTDTTDYTTASAQGSSPITVTPPQATITGTSIPQVPQVNYALNNGGGLSYPFMVIATGTNFLGTGSTPNGDYNGALTQPVYSDNGNLYNGTGTIFSPTSLAILGIPSSPLISPGDAYGIAACDNLGDPCSNVSPITVVSLEANNGTSSYIVLGSPSPAETYTISGSDTYKVANTPFFSDAGVTATASGTAFNNVSPYAPTASGTYNVSSTGLYTFYSGDAGTQVAITYDYNTNSTTPTTSNAIALTAQFGGSGQPDVTGAPSGQVIFNDQGTDSNNNPINTQYPASLILDPTDTWVHGGGGDPNGYTSDQFATQKPTVLDFNGDSIPDVLLVDSGINDSNPSLQMVIGTLPSGTFNPSNSITNLNLQTILPNCYIIASYAVADFNGDGYPDVAVLCNPNQGSTTDNSANSLSIILGNGDGTFNLTPITYGNTINSSQIVAGHFSAQDNGSYQDILYAGVVNNDIGFQVLNNVNGDGNLSGPDIFTRVPLAIGTQLSAADFDQDGYTDLAVLNGDPNNPNITIYQNTGTQGPDTDNQFNTAAGTGVAAITIPTPGAASVPSFNIVSLISGNAPSIVFPVISGNATGIYAALNTSSGSVINFNATLFSPVTGLTSAVFGDVNGDGNIDAVVDNGSTLNVLTGDGIGDFTGAAYTALTLSDQGNHLIAAVDQNYDGYADLLTYNLASSSLLNGYITAGTATATTSPQTFVGGNHNVTGQTNGTVQIAQGNTNTSSFTVGGTTSSLLPAGIFLGSNNNPSNPGQNVTFSISVYNQNDAGRAKAAASRIKVSAPAKAATPKDDGNNTPTGTVTLLNGNTTLATLTLDSNGNASYTTNALFPGSYTITANYGGDNNFTNASTFINQSVNNNSGASTITSLSVPFIPAYNAQFGTVFPTNILAIGTNFIGMGSTPGSGAPITYPYENLSGAGFTEASGLVYSSTAFSVPNPIDFSEAPITSFSLYAADNLGTPQSNTISLSAQPEIQPLEANNGTASILVLATTTESTSIPNNNGFANDTYQATNSAFFSDVSVTSTGTTFTSVTSTLPSAGQYHVSSTGLYTFNAADAGTAITITYDYIPNPAIQPSQTTPIAIQAQFGVATPDVTGAPTGNYTFNVDGGTQIASPTLDTTATWISGGTASYAGTVSTSFPPTTADFNNDGIADLLMVDPGDIQAERFPSFQLFSGTLPSGSFTPGTPYSPNNYISCNNILSYTTGDFNGDGLIDVAILCSANGPNSLYTILNNGDGTFNTPVAFSGNAAAFAYIAAGAINKTPQTNPATGIKFADLAAVGNDPTLGNGITTLLNDGTGDGGFNFGTFTSTTASNFTQLSVVDFNGDSLGDVALGNTSDSGNAVLVYQNDANNGYTLAPTAIPQGSTPFTTYPLTRGGLPSLFTFTDLANRVYDNIYVNTSTTAAISFAPIAGQITAPYGFADFNGDGYLDALVTTTSSSNANCASQCLTILTGDGTGNFAPNGATNNPGTPYPGLLVPTGSGSTSILGTADLNDDGYADLITYNGQAIQSYITAGTATASTAPQLFDTTVTHTVSATSIGNAQIAPGSTSSVQFGGSPSTTLPTPYVFINASVNPSNPGQSVTFSIDVINPNDIDRTKTASPRVKATSPAYDSNATPSGTVTLTATPLNGTTTTTLATLTLDGDGNASYSTNSLFPGQYTITANYSGDINFSPTSNSTTQTVNTNSTASSITGFSVPYVPAHNPALNSNFPTNIIAIGTNFIGSGTTPNPNAPITTIFDSVDGSGLNQTTGNIFTSTAFSTPNPGPANSLSVESCDNLGTPCSAITPLTVQPLAAQNGIGSASPNAPLSTTPTTLTAQFAPVPTDQATTIGAPSGLVTFADPTLTAPLTASLILDPTDTWVAGSGGEYNSFFVSGDGGLTPTIQDFNGDGIPDMLVVDSGSQTQNAGFELLSGTLPSGSFTTVQGSYYNVNQAVQNNSDGYNSCPLILSYTVGDFNADGLTDVAVLCSDGTPGDGNNVAYTILNNGDGTFNANPIYAADNGDGSGYFTQIAAGYINSSPQYNPATGIQFADLVAIDANPNVGNNISTLINNGDGSATFYSASTSNIYTSAFTQLTVADLNGDGFGEVIALDPTTPQIAVFQNNGNNGYPSTPTATISNIPADVASFTVAPINPQISPLPAILYTSTSTNSIYAVPNTTPEGYGPPVPPIAFGNPVQTQVNDLNAAVFGDVNGDGILDAIVNTSATDNGTVNVLTGDGTGAFPGNAYTQLTLSGSGNHLIAAPDMSGDGYADLLTYSVNSGLALLNSYITSGSASATTQPQIFTASGQHTVQITTPGTVQIAAGTTTLNFAVTGTLNATITTTAGPANTTYGQPITLTANVMATDGNGNPVDPTGTVVFDDNLGQAVTGPIPVNAAGFAQTTVSTLSPGVYTFVVAAYTSNTNSFSGQNTSSIPSATVNIAQAIPTITWAAPADIIVSTPLSSTQLDAVAKDINGNVLPGNYSYTPPATTVLGAGNNQTLSVLFIPTDSTDYANATQTTTINVIPLVLSGVNPASAHLGDPDTVITLTGTGFLTSSIVEENGTPITTTYVNPTTLRATLPASLFLTMTPITLTVLDPIQTLTTTPGFTFNVLPVVPAIVFTGPETLQPGQQSNLTFSLGASYPVPITATVTLSFAGIGGADDPAIQFSGGTRVFSFNIPADTTTTPALQFQDGTDAGTITATLGLTALDTNITPTTVQPIVITLPPAPPFIASATLTRSGDTLTVFIVGYSNTREMASAQFHFNAASGATINDPDITVQAPALFTPWFGQAASQAYGSNFGYTQVFNLSTDSSSVSSVTITLTNSVGNSVTVTAQ